MNLIMVVAGTRPEAVKLSPVLKQLHKLKMDTVFIWSGQHYDYELSKVFFRQLNLREPDVNLKVRTGTHAEQTARLMLRLEKTISYYKPSIVIAEGDTNTVLATALASTKTRVPFAHVEAGLRSYDRAMPEEINRIVADSLSELLFAPTELAVVNLTHEGVPLRKIHRTGNTVVDVLVNHRGAIIKKGKELLNCMSLDSERYLLVTLHRQENVDCIDRLSNIVKALLLICKEHKVVFPLHPKTRKRLEITGLMSCLRQDKNLIQTPSLGYFEFLGLLSYCSVVLTDSGGVQEEAFAFNIPTVTLRYNTERPETVLHGTNVLAGADTQSVVKLTISQLEKSKEIKAKKRVTNPFGDGKAGKRIVVAIRDSLEAGIEIQSCDTRMDPYVTYAIVNDNQLKDVNASFEVLSSYDRIGLAQMSARYGNPMRTGEKILIRAPKRALLMDKH